MKRQIRADQIPRLKTQSVRFHVVRGTLLDGWLVSSHATIKMAREAAQRDPEFNVFSQTPYGGFTYVPQHEDWRWSILRRY